MAAHRFTGLKRAVAALSLLSFATAFGAALVLLTQSLLARQLGPEVYGLFASSLATVSMIAPFAGFGLSQFRLRVYGAEGWSADRWIRPSLHLSLITGGAACLVVVVWALLAPAGTGRVLLPLLPIVPALLAVELVGCKLRLEERYRVLAGWQLLIPAGRLLVALVAVLLAARHVVPIAVGYGAVALLVAVLALPHVRAMLDGSMELHGHGPRPERLPASRVPATAEVWAQAWPYGVAAALYPIFFQVSTVMLKYLGGDAHAGRFGISMAVMSAIYLIPTTIYQKFLLSKLHRWATHDRPRFWLVYRRGIAAMLALGLAIGALLLVAMPWVVPLAFGPAYLGVVPILTVLALCPPIRFLCTAVGSVLLTGTHMHYRVLMMGLAAAVTISLDVLLIPAYHEMGAAWAIVAGECVLLATTWIGARRFGGEFR
ncbi:lipopolysaccharide biosynthesis protein [Lysobacter yangpyeongensis]|uniref:Lipopolysaccharide biosynthesis protein n=1 Tax=Lysobacter yangpyeongensis TaxID=346182 RepID=A0ABW0SKG2_9GAMM